jgi:NAD(P)H-dependent FMN reductase
MKVPQNALLLVGSPKPGDSSSGSLGGYLLEELEKRGVETETLRVTKAVRTEEATKGLLAAVASADLVVFSFPLYIDSLPAPAIRALELIAEGRATAADAAGGEAPAVGGAPAFVTICQSGFPEVDHNQVAVEICRNFARDAGFEWAGALVLAAGGMIGSQPLRQLQGRMRSAVKALDLAAEALAAGRPVPDEAVELMAKPPIPKPAYRFMANWGWRAQFRKQGRGGSLKDQPFA